MNFNLSHKFIDELLRGLSKNDPILVAKLINIKNQKYKELYFKDEAKRYLTEKLENSQNDICMWAEVIEHYILARNSLYNEDLSNGFESLTKSFKFLIDLIKVFLQTEFYFILFYFILLHLNSG
jgi:hypothetical protein